MARVGSITEIGKALYEGGFIAEPFTGAQLTAGRVPGVWKGPPGLPPGRAGLKPSIIVGLPDEATRNRAEVYLRDRGIAFDPTHSPGGSTLRVYYKS